MMLQKLQNTLPPAAGALGAAVFVAGLGNYMVTGQFDRQVLVLIGIGLALLLLAASYYPNEVVEILRGRSVRYGSNTFAMVVIFLSILALINFYSAKHSYRWDVTESGTHTLSSQTMAVLGQLNGPVKVTAFSPPGGSPFEDLLITYQRASDKIEYQLVDPERTPAVAREYKIQRYPVTVLEYEGRRQDITGSSEQDVTSAILKLVKGTAKKVYFLAGHGEISIDSFEGGGGDQAKEALKADNYEVAPLVLAATGSVPEDAAVIVIAGAKTPFLDEEKKAIDDYLSKGGKALVMVDVEGSPTVNEILKAQGLEIGNGVVIDPASSLPNQPQVPVIAQYEYSQITKDMQGMTLFPFTTSVMPQKDMPDGLTTAPLFESTDKSWLETDENVIRFEEDKDVKGPLTLALTLEGSGASGHDATQQDGNQSKMRMVVFGNSIFATNDVLNNPALGNRDLFVNAVNWLAEEEALISIRAKEPAMKQVFLTGTDENLVFFSSTVFLPFVVLVIAAAVWWRRR